MAAGTLQKPGTTHGPCVVACQHKDCAATRAMAESVCRYCETAIGYETRFYSNAPEPGYCHADCAEVAAEAARELS